MDVIEKDFNVAILAAGSSKRISSSKSKIFMKVAGREMIYIVLDAAKSINPLKIVIVTSESIKEELDPEEIENCQIAIQNKPNGTGDAVKIARNFLENDKGLLVLFSDTPLITSKILLQIINTKADLVICGIKMSEANSYGKIIKDQNGNVRKIVEGIHEIKDLCNGGIMYIGPRALKYLDEVNPADNGEYQLTDIVEIANKHELRVECMEANEEELYGVNWKIDLIKVEKIMQMRLKAQAIDRGAIFIDPDSVHLSFDTEIESDAVIYPNVFCDVGVKIKKDAIIYPFCFLKNCTIGENAEVGPFATLRSGTEIQNSAIVGNFVEIKNSSIGENAKIKHLAYIGDTEIGDRTNIGAGVITCNYDWKMKHETIIGQDAFIGSNSCLIAPIEIGNGAMIAAGTVVTKNVAENDLCSTRVKQKNLQNGAKRYKKLV